MSAWQLITVRPRPPSVIRIIIFSSGRVARRLSRQYACHQPDVVLIDSSFLVPR